MPFPKRLGKPEEFGSLVLELTHNTYFNGQCRPSTASAGAALIQLAVRVEIRDSVMQTMLGCIR